MGLRTRRWPRLARRAGFGVACGAVVVAVADLLAQVVAPPAAPVLAVGQSAIDLTPGWLKDAAVERFGTSDKTVLVSGVLVVVGLLCATAGVLVTTRPVAAGVLVAALSGLAVLAALSRPGATPAWALPVLVGAAVGAVLLVRGHPDRRRRGVPSPADPEGRPAGDVAVLPGRRTVAFGVPLVIAVGAQAGSEGLARLRASAPTVALPPAAQPAGPLPADVDLHAEIAADGLHADGLTPFVTSDRDFYRVDTALSVPQLDARSWRLTVTGLVDRPLTLSWSQLVSAGLVERWITLSCVSNEVGGHYAGTALWRGVPTARILRAAGAQADADMVLSRSSDGFTASTPLSSLADPAADGLIAVGMNGVPLPAEHGYPARLVVPGLYGYVSATKWLTELHVTRFDREQAYWTARGYAARAPIKTFSRIDVPAPFARLAAGTQAVAGVAWAQHRGIERVEVGVDGGAWHDARLAAVPSSDTWRQWYLPWQATPGLHTLRVRATDADGVVQTERRSPPRPDGATGWQSVTVQVV